MPRETPLARPVPPLYEAAGVRMRISSPDRVVCLKPRVTKRDVVKHLAAVARHMLPCASRRPIALLRCPDGVGGACFFQKHRSAGMPRAMGAAWRSQTQGARPRPA